MKRVILLTLALVLVRSLPALAQNVNANCTKETDQRTSAGASGTLTFLDGCGTQSNSFELILNGSPTGVSITINGVMRGNTVTALASSTSTSNATLNTTGGPFDSYTVVFTLTGGSSPTLTVNRTASANTARAGSYSGAPGAVTVAGVNQVFRSGSSWCKDLGLAWATYPAGDASVAGYKYPSNFVCPVADVQSMFANVAMANVQFGGGRFYLPMFASVLGTNNTTAAGCSVGVPCPAVPPMGPIVLPSNGVFFEGHGSSPTAGNSGDTEFELCTGSGSPFPGCVGPVTREWTIASTTITHVAGVNGGDYLGVKLNPGSCPGGCNIPGSNTSTASDIAAGEVIRIMGSGKADNNGDWRVCSTVNGAGIFAYNSTVGDPGCPAPPITAADGATTTFYTRVNSGITSVTISGAGSGYGTNSNTSIIFSGCTHNPTGDVTVSGGAVTAVNIHYPGDCRGVTPTYQIFTGSPAVLNNSATLTFTLSQACASSCGTVHATLYIFNGGPGGSTNAFNRGLENLFIDCGSMMDVGGTLDLYANETVRYNHITIKNCPERGLDRHTVQAQNAPTMNDIRVIVPTSTNTNVGTEAVFLGDVATHGIKGLTIALGGVTSANCALRIDALGAPGVTIENAHGEVVLNSACIGQGAPSDVIHFQNFAGPPAINPTSDGAFQNERTCGARFFANYAFINTGQGLLDFGLDSIARNGNVNIFNVCDEVTTAITGFDAFINDYSTTRWDVDYASGNLSTLTTSSFGSNMPNGFDMPFLMKNGAPFGGGVKYVVTSCETSGGDTTLNVGGTTTNTGVSCLPQASVIDAVLYYITTTITTAASFQIGDSTTVGRFCTAQSTLTAGTSGICATQWFSATAGTMGQLAASTVRITTNANPGAGKIRLAVISHTFNTLNF